MKLFEKFEKFIQIFRFFRKICRGSVFSTHPVAKYRISLHNHACEAHIGKVKSFYEQVFEIKIFPHKLSFSIKKSQLGRRNPVKLSVGVIDTSPVVFLITELHAALPNNNMDNNRFAEVEVLRASVPSTRA